jgi:hypothetical protein
MYRYLLTFLFSTSIILAILFPLSVYFQPLSGDLTRIGGYAEVDFGWNKEPKIVEVMANTHLNDKIDVLILGDSFSEKNIWQSKIARDLNFKSLSFAYKGDCIQSWIDFALSQPVSTIVIETAEKEFLNRFEELVVCSGNTFFPVRVMEGTTPNRRPQFELKFYLKHTLMSVIHKIQIQLDPEVRLKGKTVSAPLLEQCALFSNRKPNRLLYYPYDEAKLDWSNNSVVSAVENVLHLQRQVTLHAKKFIFLVVPDKLSIYQHCLKDFSQRNVYENINISEMLAEQGVNTLDLRDNLSQEVNSITDLYLPNDTHFSTDGYLRFAELIKPLFELDLQR